MGVLLKGGTLKGGTACKRYEPPVSGTKPLVSGTNHLVSGTPPFRNVFPLLNDSSPFSRLIPPFRRTPVSFFWKQILRHIHEKVTGRVRCDLGAHKAAALVIDHLQVAELHLPRHPSGLCPS